VLAGAAADGDDPSLSGRFRSGGHRGSFGHATGDRQEPPATFLGSVARQAVAPLWRDRVMNLDEQLRSALRRQDPSPGVAAQVLQQTDARKRVPFWRRPLWLWPAVATAMVAVSISASLEYRHVQAERASRQAILALRIASEKLNHARNRVLKLNTE